jgi:CRP-like cAMP-binding protein
MLSVCHRARTRKAVQNERAFIDESCRYQSATITAETGLHCLMFPKWGFRHFAMSHPQTAWALLEMMAQRVRDAENR